jgi:hypothetical protein
LVTPREKHNLSLYFTLASKRTLLTSDFRSQLTAVVWL